MIQVEADAGEDWDSRIGWADLAREAAGSALRHSEFVQLMDSGLVAEISVKFTSDAEVRALNACYRNKDKPTNVLSFPMDQPDLLQTVSQNSDDGELLLGDIVLAHDVCAAEAGERGISVETHATHLLVHGVLHLLGYDHMDDGEAEAMEEIERQALGTLGIADPYLIRED